MIHIDTICRSSSRPPSPAFRPRPGCWTSPRPWPAARGKRLERELGLRLLVQSTRSMRLSDEGARYLPHARAVLAALAAGQEALDQGQAAPRDASRAAAAPLRYGMGEHTHERWSFHLPSQGGPQTVPVRGDRISDDGEVVRRWALAGQGITYKAALDMTEDLRAGAWWPSSLWTGVSPARCRWSAQTAPVSVRPSCACANSWWHAAGPC